MRRHHTQSQQHHQIIQISTGEVHINCEINDKATSDDNQKTVVYGVAGWLVGAQPGDHTNYAEGEAAQCALRAAGERSVGHNRQMQGHSKTLKGTYFSLTLFRTSTNAYKW